MEQGSGGGTTRHGDLTQAPYTMTATFHSWRGEEALHSQEMMSPGVSSQKCKREDAEPLQGEEELSR
jgi:hypothetical protein